MSEVTLPAWIKHPIMLALAAGILALMLATSSRNAAWLPAASAAGIAVLVWLLATRIQKR